MKNKQALRYNQNKVQWSLVHFPSIEPLVRVLEFGEQKYSRDNWMSPMPLNKILESAMRHLVSLMNGEELDSESGLPHSGHIMCNMMFFEFQRNRLKK